MFTKQLVVGGLAALLIGALSACGGGSGSDDSTRSASGVGQGSSSAPQKARPTPDTVTGLRDSLRHFARQTAKGTRPHTVTKCTPATKKVQHKSSSGSGAKKKTRTWYTTEQYRKCKKVRSGTETYTRIVRAERWCVSLDDVGGNTAKDDVWYQVTRAAYDKARTADEHARVEFTPTGSGC
ncbi:hypothetical protein OG496_52140 [Streptomyces sp. NBC_00988]|uniref:hypothetical protein n=1 Tax=Streptomyces sp. NBC_00988 TaxID=2903704 RepID=UPI003869B264|nr:hypothetical protein OG496_52140 [Streptomyces sp. NBC_00988]